MKNLFLFLNILKLFICSSFSTRKKGILFFRRALHCRSVNRRFRPEAPRAARTIVSAPPPTPRSVSGNVRVEPEEKIEVRLLIQTSKTCFIVDLDNEDRIFHNKYTILTDEQQRTFNYLNNWQERGSFVEALLIRIGCVQRREAGPRHHPDRATVLSATSKVEFGHEEIG